MQPAGIASLQTSVQVFTLGAGAWSAAGQAGELLPLRAASCRQVKGKQIIVAAPHPRAAKQQDLLPVRTHSASRQTAVQR